MTPIGEGKRNRGGEGEMRPTGEPDRFFVNWFFILLAIVLCGLVIFWLLQPVLKLGNGYLGVSQNASATIGRFAGTGIDFVLCRLSNLCTT